MRRKPLWFLGLAHALALTLALFGRVARPDEPCPLYATVTYRLDLKKAQAHRVAVSNRGERHCGALTADGAGGGRVEIVRSGVKVFERAVPIALTGVYEPVSGKGARRKLEGRPVPLDETWVTALLPVERLRGPGTATVRFIDDTTGEVLAVSREKGAKR